jgi:hypothetical protein
MQTLYRAAQRQLLGIDKTVRNEVLAAVTARPTLQTFAIKLIYRYYFNIVKYNKGRLVEKAMSWAKTVENERVSSQLSILKGAALTDRYRTVKDIYMEYVRASRFAFDAADRINCTELAALWE